MSSSSRDVVANVLKVFAFLLMSLHDLIHVVNDDEFISSTGTSNIEPMMMRHESEVLDADDV